MTEHDYNYMRKNILLYYKKYILMESFLKRFSNKKFPLEVFLNVDHYTYDQKISRDVKNNKITFNSKNSNV